MEREILEIISKENQFYNDLKEDKNDRYKSWEYCYYIFYKAHLDSKLDDDYIDYLCLNLAFYLASWGMYRGSSFLLQKDYKIHKNIILELFKDKYKCLWAINVNQYKDENVQKTLFDLVKNLKLIYNEIRKDIKKEEIKNDISNTLITKVLMGTMGCVPAYDRYFIAGIRKYKIAFGSFNIKSILDIVEFYNKYYDIFENIRKNRKIKELEYPQMKIIDMCFWKAGYDLDK